MAGGGTDRQGARLPRVPRVQGVAREGERRPGLRAAGIAAARIAAPIVAKRGGVLARLKAHWAEAAGDEFAAIAWPEALGRDGGLKLRVLPGFALELQHRAPLLIERITLFFGHAAVTRLALVQGPLPLAAQPRPAAPAPLSAAAQQSLDSRLAGITNPELRAALAGLGQLLPGGARGGR
ncbi:MAG TPA: DciA family protein [Stellaceae bacterium]|nr:DciA family protein [Stellaceae bacterium]